MSNGTKCFFAFIFGAAAGSIVTWRLLEKACKAKYRQIADEEIDSVYEQLNLERKPTIEEDIDTIVESGYDFQMSTSAKNEQIDIREYASKLAEHEYTNYAANANTEKKEETDTDEPYIISPTEFGELDEYETYTFTYYANNVLTDEMDEPIEDIERLIGSDALNHFGDYEPDSVCVRNEALKRDIEILLDSGTYDDPYPAD